MIENTLFILGAFLVARALGAILNLMFERLFPDEPVAKGFRPAVPPRQPVGASARKTS